ncbi:hypothetical protein AGMMS50267_00630 [Spirochaetia bacterium]|nr:hypothetical protein AGMMS50267_00630 [Spirochaetia bacterium]
MKGEIMNKRLSLSVGLLCAAILAACPTFYPFEFTRAPGLILSPADGSLRVTWTSASPEADSYDVYYAPGTLTGAAALKSGGTKIANTARGRIIAGLTSGEVYSVMVTANKEGLSIDSAVKQGTAGNAVGKAKRGVGHNSKDTPMQDMALLTPGVKWFYDWGIAPNSAVDTAAQTYNMTYMPMVWSGLNEGALRAYKTAHPECEYLLAYNEPNLTDQANMTPAQAAERWPALLAIAQELNLKIVSPAMNYGTLSGYGDPVKWLDEFFTKPGVSLDDVSAIAIHCYMQYPSAIKSYIERFKKYGKPLWVTEFCAWENIANGTQQMEYMSDIVTYMELDPAVERYAWFIAKGGSGSDVTAKPYNKLLTRTNPPELTGLGAVYVNMSACDTSVYASCGQQIEAEHFTGCNLSDWIDVSGFSRSVRFRPTTDSDDTSGGLDIYDFTQNTWVEYQIDLAVAASGITLRNSTTGSAAAVQIAIDGAAAGTVSLPQGGWKTTGQAISLPAGKHTIRLTVSSGNCALNWIKVE